MKTQYFTATSLDGFIATEDDSLEWLFPLADVNESSYPEFISEIGAIAMGSSTYEWMLRNADKVAAETGSAWPYSQPVWMLRNADKVAAETGSAWPYSQPVWVFSSRTLPLLDGGDIRIVGGDVRIVHADMQRAAAGRNIWIVGGGDLAGQFYDAGLLDELIIQIGSVTLGNGKPLFPRRVLSPHLRLTAARQIGAGMAELRYAVAPRVDD